MAAGVKVEVDKNNLRDIDLMFQQLPKQVDKNKVWVKFWRENSKPLQRSAKENAAKLNKSKSGTGQLAKSVGFFTTKASRKYNGGYVGPRVKGRFAKIEKETKEGKKLKGKKQYTKSGFYGAFVEYGGEVKFGGKGTGSNQPWMRKAWDSSHKQVLNNGMLDAEKIFARALKVHERRLKKFGKLGY